MDDYPGITLTRGLGEFLVIPVKNGRENADFGRFGPKTEKWESWENGRENLSGSGEGVTHYRTGLAAYYRRSGGVEPACLTSRFSPERTRVGVHPPPRELSLPAVIP